MRCAIFIKSKETGMNCKRCKVKVSVSPFVFWAVMDVVDWEDFPRRGTSTDRLGCLCRVGLGFVGRAVIKMYALWSRDGPHRLSRNVRETSLINRNALRGPSGDDPARLLSQRTGTCKSPDVARCNSKHGLNAEGIRAGKRSATTGKGMFLELLEEMNRAGKNATGAILVA